MRCLGRRVFLIVLPAIALPSLPLVFLRVGTLSPKHRYCLEAPGDCWLGNLISSQSTIFFHKKGSTKRQRIGLCLYGKAVNRRECMSRIRFPQVGSYKLGYNSVLNLDPTWVSNHIRVLVENYYFLPPGEDILKYTSVCTLSPWDPRRPTAWQPRLRELTHQRILAERCHKVF